MLEVIERCKRLKFYIGLIPRVKIFKMASKMAPKMAASNAIKTYLTHKLDKKDLIWTFLWLFRGLMIQMSKMENWFGLRNSNI